MLGNLKIGKRLLLIVASLFIGMSAVCVFSLVNLKHNLTVERENQAKAVVDAATGIIAQHYERAQKENISQADAKAEALKAIGGMHYGSGDYVFVHDTKGLFLSHPRWANENHLDEKDAVGRAFVQDFVATSQKGGGFVTYYWKRDASKPPAEKISYVKPFEAWGLVVGTGIYVDDVNKAFISNSLLLGGITAVLFGLVGGLALTISRGITRPLSDIAGAMDRLAKGDKTVQVNFTHQADEIGDLARALELFKAAAIKMEAMEKESMNEQKKAEQRALMVKLADEFETNVKVIVDIVSAAAVEMQSSAESLSANAAETTTQASAVVKAAEVSSVNIQTVASASEELNASIGEINRQIADSANIASACLSEAESTNTAMHALGKAADEVGTVVKLIEDITSKVNLLALNATIEAARAGDAGRGFAVVATEVKNLANQVDHAAKNITSQITGIQGRTSQAVNSITSITNTIRRINEISTVIAGAVIEQGSATKDISRSIQETARGTAEVTQNINSVTRVASETSAASTQMLQTSAQLAKESRTLTDVVDAFIADIRRG